MIVPSRLIKIRGRLSPSTRSMSASRFILSLYSICWGIFGGASEPSRSGPVHFSEVTLRPTLPMLVLEHTASGYNRSRVTSTIHCATGLRFLLPVLVERILDRIVGGCCKPRGLIIRRAIIRIKQIDSKVPLIWIPSVRKGPLDVWWGWWLYLAKLEGKHST